MPQILATLGRGIRWIGLLAIMAISVVLMAVTTFNSHPEEHRDAGPWRFAVHMENQFLDWRQRNSLQRQPDRRPSEHAILAAIDEKSILNIGRFPWSRGIWAQLLDVLGELGARVVAFDVIFSEEEISCNSHPDARFAQAIARFPHGPGHVIVGHSKTHDPALATEKFPDALFNSLLNTTQTGHPISYPTFVQRSTFPIPALVDSGVGIGFIDMQDDGDGVFRHYTLLANLVAPQDLRGPQGGVDSFSPLFPSFGLLSYMRYLDDEVSLETAADGQTGWLMAQGGVLELDGYAATRLRYRGGREAFREISIWDILQAGPGDEQMRQLIAGKAVFIGSTAFAAHDFRNSPMGPQMPGVLFHMNVLDMLSDGRFPRPLGEGLLASMALLAVVALLLIAIQWWRNPLLDTLTACTLMMSLYLLDIFYLLPEGHEVKLLCILGCLLALFLWNGAVNFYRISKEKQQIRGTFSQYVSPSIVNEILAHPEKLKMGGEKRDITVFFSDVRDFTTISESLTPSELSHCLNQYMNRMTHILFDFKGTLDKYIGDAIVGYWGAPIALEGHPTLALQAAIQMIESLPQINQDFERQGYPQFRVGIGINTGECSVGNMGSEQIFSYTALGDHMNLGARLEGLCKYYGAQIIISQFTYDRLAPDKRQEMQFRDLGMVRVKGKQRPVKIIEVLYRQHPLYQRPQDLAIYRQAQEALLARQFSTARQLAGQFLSQYPQDLPAQHLRERAQHYLQHPPPEDWDGTTTMTSK